MLGLVGDVIAHAFKVVGRNRERRMSHLPAKLATPKASHCAKDRENSGSCHHPLTQQAPHLFGLLGSVDGESGGLGFGH